MENLIPFTFGAAVRIVTWTLALLLIGGLSHTFYSFLLVAATDFQFKNTRIEADEIYTNVKDTLQEGATVYIATDERKKAFFDPLKAHYNVFFMDDFKKELEGVNKNYFGMIDQLVASRGRQFYGCFHST